jgi:hypothetical protein
LAQEEKTQKRKGAKGAKNAHQQNRAQARTQIGSRSGVNPRPDLSEKFVYFLCFF